MFEHLRNPVLHVLRVPHDPTPPAGAPGSVRVFRAGRNFYKLRLLGWSFGQLGALIGIVVSLNLLDRLEDGVEAFREEARRSQSQPPAERASSPEEKTKTSSPKKKARPDWKQRVGRTADRWPMWVFPLLKILEWGGVLLYLIQIPVTYALARLDFEMRWYIVTDRSLRIRSGLATVEEITMSFANLQQVLVTQGPVQRLLGLANVCVQSAGGGGGGEGAHGNGGSGHMGVFRGVDNAHEIRDLVLARLRQFREAGLGDPDDALSHEVAAPPASADPALAAARELLTEARELRRTMT